MASSKMFVCNVFGEVLDGERDHPRAHTADQCYQPSGLRQTFQGPKPILPASENFDLTGSTSPRDFDFEVKVEPPDTFDPTHGRPFDDDSADDFRVKKEAVMLEDVKIEVSSSSEGNPTSEDETFTVNHGASENSSETRERHPRLIRASQQHACKKCAFKSKLRIALTQHIRKFHQNLQQHACEKCDFKSKSKSGLTLHIRKFHRKVKCTICDYRTDRVGSMKKHLLIHERKKEYMCHACPYKCNSRMLIKRHLLNIHTVSQVYACEKCVFTSKSWTGLAVHKWYIHQRFLSCEFCGKKFRTDEALSLHLRTHNGEKKYACYHCKYTCNRRNMIKTHIAKKHPVMKCHCCDHRTNCKGSMRKHFLLLHKSLKPYACKECDYKCRSNGDLNAHMTIHTGEKKFACEFCDYRAARRDTYKKHVMTHTGAVYQCHYCQAYLPNRFRLKNHIFKKHLKESPYACKMCDKRFNRRDYLIGHMNLHRGEMPFACNSCSFKTHLQEHLHTHIKRKHSGEERWYECERCSYKTHVEHYLKRHRKKTHFGSLSCDVCGFSTPSTFRMKVHMNAHSFMEFYPNLEQPFHCILCNFKNHSMDRVTRHVIKHKATFPEKNKRKSLCRLCQICGFLCTSQASLKSHLRIHTGEKPYACHLCDYKCRKGEALAKHIRSHLGLKPYACKECDYKCRGNGDLNRHMTIHTGEKKFACEFCDYRAARRETYKRHVMTHTGNKPHACNICSYKAAASSDLKRHMMTHTVDKTFKCEACSFKTVTRATFEKHIVTHKGMKKYICFTCKEMRYGRERFKKHLNSHTGDKEYVCFVCRYKCSRRSEIIFHFECANKEGSHWPVLSKYQLLSKCKTD